MSTSTLNASLGFIPFLKNADTPAESKKKPKALGGKGKAKAPLDPANYPKELALARSQHTPRWNNPHSYSVALGIGYARQSFNNEKGKFEHQGLQARAAAGFRANFGRWRDHIFLPRFFYEYQGNNYLKIGNDYLSKARTHRFGVELNYLYEAVPTWLQVGGALGFGMAAYRTKQGPLVGAMYNGGLPRTLRAVGTHVELSALLCTFNALACVKGTYGADVGMKEGMEGLNTHGFSIGLVLDAMRFLHHPTPKAVHRRYHGQKNDRA